MWEETETDEEVYCRPQITKPRNCDRTLYWALYSFSGDIKKIQKLVDSGANVNFAFNGVSLLEIAIKKDCGVILDILCDNQVDVNTMMSNGRRPLGLLAERNGPCSFIQKLINSGADVNLRDETNMTAVQI